MARGDPGEATYTPEVMPEDFPRKLTPRIDVQEAGMAGRAIGDIANTLDQKYKADTATWAGEQISNFRVQALKTLDDMKGQVQGDPSDFTSKYLAAFDKQAQPLTDTGNPVAHAMIQKGLGDLRNTLTEHSMEWEATQRVAYRTDAIKTGLQNQLPLVEAHPELADQVGSTLMDQINTVGGNPSQRLGMARSMHEQLSEAAAYGLARQNPRGVLDTLNNPSGSFDATKAPGMVKPGNLDPYNRPILNNPDGSYSTTSSISIGTDDGEVLIPTVVNGKRLSEQAAIAQYKRTGENFGTFKDPDSADKFATALHNDQARHIEGASPILTGLTVDQIERVRSRANQHLADPVFAALSQNDISGAQRQLNQNADVMDPHTYESVQRGILATQEHQIVMQEKNQKLASDNLSKEGDSLLANGQLTARWIEGHRNTLEPNEFRYFYKALSGTDESATNPRVFADLYLKAANGQDVRDDARSALVDSHTLSRADFTKIAGLVDTERPGWFKRGTQSIAGSLDPGQLNPDPDAHHSRALALQDWEDWAQKHPQATDKEAEVMSNTISDHYRIVPAASTVLSMKAPLYLTGTRAQPVDEQGKPDPMLNATARRTMAALKAGEINAQEAQEQALLIQQYRTIAQRQSQAAADAAKKKASQ